MLRRRVRQALAEGGHDHDAAAVDAALLLSRSSATTMNTSAESSWAPCEDDRATAQCVDCMNSTRAALGACMGVGQAFFPGNLQPLIASRGGLARLRLAASNGTTVRKVCEEWGVSHDGALVMLAWMLRLPYLEASHKCGAYRFAKGAAADECEAAPLSSSSSSSSSLSSSSELPSESSSESSPSTGSHVALLDRVKRHSDLPSSCWPGGTRPKDGDSSGSLRMHGAGDADHDDSADDADVTVDPFAWDACLAEQGHRAARAYDLDTVVRTAWWARLREQATKKKAAAAGVTGAGKSGQPVTNLNDGELFEPWVGAGGALDVFSMADCRRHKPATLLGAASISAGTMATLATTAAAMAAVAAAHQTNPLEAAPGALALTAAAWQRLKSHPLAASESSPGRLRSADYSKYSHPGHFFSLERRSQSFAQNSKAKSRKP
jgi:hypothetical protein